MPPLSPARLFPARYRLLLWVASLFLLVQLATRIGLFVFDGLPGLGVAAALRVLATGLLYDLSALSYALLPFALLALLWPNTARGRRGHAISASALLAAALMALFFIAVSEFVFWNEFSSRFNFIAVDYLVYTREVIGNVRESYPVGWILGGIAALAVATVLALRRPVWQAASDDGGHWARRIAATALLLGLPVLSFVAVGDGPREAIASAAARELAGNGPYEFMRAFRSNDLDFRAFYRTVPEPIAEDELRAEVVKGGSRPQFTGGVHPLERRIAAAGPMKPLNVVLVSMESLGSDYVESFGGRKGLTPELDRLAREGMAFDQLYASGLRTVRGLEALTLSIPPTPGHAVPMRPNNKGFQTLGGVFKEQGWEPLYLYGGYSRFDNMQDFFGGNGYTVIDRNAIDAKTISHETVWGVADEDLFRLSLREIDARVAAGQRVFAHVMTTTNHRPFTYPEGRIDIPSGTSREGAVRYSDWAIGEFVREARTRPWFDDTVFVFIADHTSNGRGRTDLPPENYRIPMIVWSPKHVAPRRIDTLASQIDVAPTLLALLNVGYTSRFFGQDILSEGVKHQRAFMSNYLTVGYMEDGLVAELSPKRRAKVRDAATGRVLPADDPAAQNITAEAVAYYQVATRVLRGEPVDARLILEP